MPTVTGATGVELEPDKGTALDFTFKLREGLSVQPPEGDITTDYWIKLANEGDQLSRVSAFIVLLNMGLDITVALGVPSG